MTKEEHIEFHKTLHKNLDKIVADWIGCTGKLPSDHTVMDLMTWSFKQTTEPDDFEEGLGPSEEKE